MTGPIDCHAHVFTVDLPMAADARYRPTTDAPLGAYLRQLDAAGMACGVLVQPSFLGTDNAYLLDALAQCAPRLRGVAVVDASWSDGALSDLRAAGVRGLRYNLIGRPLPNLQSVVDRDLVTRAAAAGLHIEVQSEGAAWGTLLPQLLRLGATVVVDHFGRPEAADPAQSAGFAAVLAAARSPGVWVKLSAPYRFQADADAAARAILAAAGPDRLLWGSDWPWTQHPDVTSYTGLRDRLSTWIPDSAVRRAVLEDNPRRLYWR